MRPVVVIAEHPSLAVGFASVAVHVATQLRERGWSVRYLGFGSPVETESSWEFPVEADAEINAIGERLAGLAQLMPVVVFFGRALHFLEIEERLRHAGVRDQVDLTYYAAIDYTPAPAALGALVDAADRIVPSTRFAALALGMPVSEPIPHGVDTAVFRPLSRRERLAARVEELGVTDELVIGYFGRNSRHKRPDLAIRAFAHLATGAYGICSDCAALTVAELEVSGSFRSAMTCRRCRASSLVAGSPHPDALLFMHTDLSDASERRISGGFDLPLLARRFGVAERVIFDTSLQVGRGIPVERLAGRMAAVDIHLLLCEGGGWELTVLETAACGVPNVVTEYAAPAEYAAPFSRMIPVANQVFYPSGIAGVADLDAAVAALADLAADPCARATLGAVGPSTAGTYDWQLVGRRWHDLLCAVAT